jgi:hypothetical protein
MRGDGAWGDAEREVGEDDGGGGRGRGVVVAWWRWRTG